MTSRERAFVVAFIVAFTVTFAVLWNVWGALCETYLSEFCEALRS